jgi:glucose-6-phosphate isomerase
MSKKLINTKAYTYLKTLSPPSLRKELTPQRINDYCINSTPLTFSYATSLIDDHILSGLVDLANEQDVVQTYKDLLKGTVSNKNEHRQVLHHLTRNFEKKSIFSKEYARISNFTNQIHTKTILSYTGKPFTDIVQVGIGGSKLGPEAIHSALKSYFSMKDITPHLNAHFLGNSDPLRFTFLSKTLPLDTTLFVFVSKSGTTPETLANFSLLEAFLTKKGLSISAFKDNLVAVTCPKTNLDDPQRFRSVFYFQNSIGGRFSTTSASGITLLMACFGEPIIKEFLSGAHANDLNSLEENPKDNCSLMAALLSVWDHTLLGFNSKAIIPYSSGLDLLPHFLQQLICESNGKQTDLDGGLLTHSSAPIVFGEAGTNCQHSFFQLLHQGTDKIPVQFIGFKSCDFSSTSSEIETSKKLTLSSLIAQMTALAVGEKNSDLNKHFYGERPSTLLIGDSYSPYALGALLAFFENMVMFEGFLLHINSFDQEGVQLGKMLTTSLLKESKDPLLSSFLNLF